MFLVHLLAPLLSVLLYIPQARLVWGARNDPEKLAGVSFLTYSLILLNSSCWMLLAIDLQSVAVGIPSLVNVPLALMILILKVRARRMLKNDAVELALVEEG